MKEMQHFKKQKKEGKLELVCCNGFRKDGKCDLGKECKYEHYTDGQAKSIEKKAQKDFDEKKKSGQ